MPVNGNPEDGCGLELAAPLSSVQVDSLDTEFVPLALQWFALEVKPRHEKAIWRVLKHKGYEAFLPLYRRNHRYERRSREFELPLFPGYVFCRFDRGMPLPVVTTQGVFRIVGAGRTPIPIAEVEIRSLQTAIGAGIPVQPVPYLQAGSEVRIDDGPLVGMEGRIVRVKDSLRVVLSITLLQRSVSVEVDPEWLSPAARGGSRW